jgi:DNA mismatch repair protein PMS2
LANQTTNETTSSEADGFDSEDAEAKLSLRISKSDFGKMKIIGQFNLGFIIAVRGREEGLDDGAVSSQDDELFIIDQHASDEKYNFERLQAKTVVQSQRLVRPKTLELTAMEEEVVMENLSALETNGFNVKIDDSGEQPVGSRCQLMSLPLSRETTFSLADLEELIFLLSENPASNATTVPRPSKVRKMFAMRACRSSIMIGKALSHKQMQNVVTHMGEMEKPWNCPHGRPTMRHLCGLGVWDEKGWMEDFIFDERGSTLDWSKYVKMERTET